MAIMLMLILLCKEVTMCNIFKGVFNLVGSLLASNVHVNTSRYQPNEHMSALLHHQWMLNEVCNTRPDSIV